VLSVAFIAYSKVEKRKLSFALFAHSEAKTERLSDVNLLHRVKGRKEELSVAFVFRKIWWKDYGTKNTFLFFYKYSVKKTHQPRTQHTCHLFSHSSLYFSLSLVYTYSYL
jgi:hypothetical protein